MEDNKTKRILIVDDTSINRRLIKTILKSYGFNSIDEAINGIEAINRVIENDYGLIFMDIQMPIMNGIDATTHIRRILNRTLPIIAITAYDNIAVEENGFNYLIRKPYKVDEINLVLNRFMNLVVQ